MIPEKTLEIMKTEAKVYGYYPATPLATEGIDEEVAEHFLFGEKRGYELAMGDILGFAEWCSLNGVMYQSPNGNFWDGTNGNRKTTQQLFNEYKKCKNGI